MKFQLSFPTPLELTVMLSLFTACQQCRRPPPNADADAALFGSPDQTGFDPKEIPGKGWYCYNWLGHYGPPAKPWRMAAHSCTRQAAACLEDRPRYLWSTPSTKRAAECRQPTPQAVCLKTYLHPEFRQAEIKCFGDARECQQYREIILGFGDRASACVILG